MCRALVTVRPDVIGPDEQRDAERDHAEDDDERFLCLFGHGAKSVVKLRPRPATALYLICSPTGYALIRQSPLVPEICIRIVTGGACANLPRHAADPSMCRAGHASRERTFTTA